MTNGPSNTMGLAKFSSNLTDLTVTIFGGYVRLAVSFSFFFFLSVVLFRGHGCLSVGLRSFSGRTKSLLRSFYPLCPFVLCSLDHSVVGEQNNFAHPMRMVTKP